MLGGQLMKVFGNEAAGWDRADVDVTQDQDLKLKIKDLKPEAIINCVAFNDVDGAEEKSEIAYKLNADVPKNLATICNELNIPLIHFSTNYVFEEGQGEYLESDEPRPKSVYAKSKAEGEKNVINTAKKYYLIRTAVIFGPKGESEMSKKSFVELMLDLSAKQAEVKAVNDEVNSITYAPDLARAVQVLLSQQFPYGIYHLTNLGSASWYDLAKEIFSITKKAVSVIPVPAAEFPRKASRPQKSVLLNTKFIEFRPWQEALKEFLI